jgi:hypothetical protein
LEDESFSTPSEFSEDSNIDTPHTNSTNSFSTAREYNEMSVLPSQSQNTSRRLSTGDLFDSLVEDDPLDDTSTNNTNLENSVFVTEVPQHIYDPAELLYLEKKVSFFFIIKQQRETWLFLSDVSLVCLFVCLFVCSASTE